MKTRAELVREGKRLQTSIAMLVILVSFSMLFAALMLGYVVFRATNPIWPPMGLERIALNLPLASTLLILASSISYIAFKHFWMKGKESLSKMLYVLTVILGLGFMSTQMILWDHLGELGYTAGGGIFQSILFGFTWIHAAHVVVGMIWLLTILPAIFKPAEEKYENRVISAGKFWHFLDVVWFVMFVGLFVL